MSRFRAKSVRDLLEAASNASQRMSAKTDTHSACAPMPNTHVRGNVVPPWSSKEAAVKKSPVDPALQGEGNYIAARRHRASVKKFVQSGKVEQAAEDAAPRDESEARELLEAEEQGAAPARK